jgi:VWFA-related protein
MGNLTPQNSVTGAIQTIQSRLGNISQRQMALVITNSSVVSQRHTASEPDDAVGKIDMPVYVLDVAALDPHSAADNGSLSAVAFLSGLASRTGGEYIAMAQQDVPNVLSRIVIALRNMYFLGYTPSNSPRDGGYRSLQVSIEPPRGLPPLTVHYRPGR